jgi:hypothetical protein
VADTVASTRPFQSIDAAIRCPVCGRSFVGILALDVHRRHPRAPLACRYIAGELRGGWRPSLYARPVRG